MKGSTVLWIAGGIIIAGVAAYGIYKYFEHQEKDTTETTDESALDHIIIPDTISDDISQHKTVGTDFEQAQQDTVASIQVRHQAAAQQIKETLSEMEKDSVEFEEKINQINDDLDKLLK